METCANVNYANWNAVTRPNACRSYTITYQSAGENGIEKALNGTCESEVVMNFMYSEKAVKLERLSHMKVVLNQSSD